MQRYCSLILQRLSPIISFSLRQYSKEKSCGSGMGALKPPLCPRKQRVCSGSIKVHGISFRYAKSEPFIFENITLNIDSGESVALVGPSGCGKTTLVKCLMGLLHTEQGEILIDGKKVEEHPEYRSKIAAVMQDDQLISGSICDNISFFEAKIDMERIYECAKLAAIHCEIIQMPMNYNTLIGDMGTSISSGQKQRILLARALYRRPKILFLDEATSHLDINNETLVNDHIKQLNITRIIVAHRPETINSADRVISLTKP